MTSWFGRRPLAAGLVLTLIFTGLVFSPSFSNALLNWDDPANITENAAIQSITWPHVKAWFTEPVLGMYSPLASLSFAIDFRVGGLNPAVYHATNLALHLVNVALVCVIVLVLVEHTSTALVVAALFAVHPAIVAAVTPISVRSSLLCSAFYLGAYLAYLGYVRRPDRSRLAITFVLFVCAGLSKSAAVTFPVLMLLTDAWRGRAMTRQTLTEKVPFLAGAVVLGLVTLASRGDVGAGHALETSFVERLSLAAYQLVVYAGRVVVPVGLSAYYPYPVRAGASLPMAVYLVPLAAVAAAAAAWRLGVARRLLLFSAAFFVLHLVLVLKIVPIGAEFMADRYLYLPSIALFLLVADGVRQARPALRRVGVVAAVTAVLLFSTMAYGRHADWKDSLTFYNRILERHPTAAVAYANRAAARVRDLGDYEGAVRDAGDAIRLDPAYAGSYFNRATALLLLRRPGEAQPDASRAVELNGRAPAYRQLRAEVRLALGDYRGAVEDASAAIAAGPESSRAYMAYSSRAVARFSIGDDTGAIDDFTRAIALKPREAALYVNRGQARVATGDRAGGCNDLRTAVSLGRDDARALVAQFCR